MSRTNKKGELFSHLTSFGVFRDQTSTPGSTTLSAAVAAGASNLPMTATTNFTNGDYMRVDSAESVEILKIEGATNVSMPLREKVGKAHEAGVAVVEQTLTDLGHIADDGFKFNFSGSDNVVNSATRRLALGYLIGNIEGIFEVQLEGFNLENIATALGMPESAVTGSGTLASPNTLFTDGANFRTENDLSFGAWGVRKDGLIVYCWMMGVELDFNALSSAFARGQPAMVPLRGRVTSGVRWGVHAAT